MDVISSSRSFRRSARLLAISLYFSGFTWRNARSSNSHLTCQIPSLFASGAKISRVSCAILFRLTSGMYPKVRILCRRSASFIKTTRISSPIARNTFRNVSLERSLFLNLDDSTNSSSMVSSSSSIDSSLAFFNWSARDTRGRFVKLSNTIN